MAIESLMRKFALIAIRETALYHCAFSLILTVIGQRTWIHCCIPFRYSRACSRISRLCIPAWVLTARYREYDKWKAKRLSFICQIPFLSVGAMAAVNVDTSCCPKDPFNPSRENFALILALSMSRNVINSFCSLENFLKGREKYYKLTQFNKTQFLTFGEISYIFINYYIVIRENTYARAYIN